MESCSLSLRTHYCAAFTHFCYQHSTPRHQITCRIRLFPYRASPHVPRGYMRSDDGVGTSCSGSRLPLTCAPPVLLFIVVSRPLFRSLSLSVCPRVCLFLPHCLPPVGSLSVILSLYLVPVAWSLSLRVSLSPAVSLFSFFFNF